MQNIISEVEVRIIEENGGLVGFANVVFANSLYLSSIGIHARRCGGYRLTYPTRNNVNGTFHIFHPINKAIGDQLEHAVITRFEELIHK